MAGAGRDAAAVLEHRADVAPHRLPDRREAEQRTLVATVTPAARMRTLDVEDRVELRRRRPTTAAADAGLRLGPRSRARATALPAAPSAGPSVISWRASRPRPAPAPARSASSRRRRLRSRGSSVATLAQAMSRTRPTSAPRSSNGVANYLARVVLASRTGQQPEVRSIAVGSIRQRRLHHLLQRRIQRRLRFGVTGRRGAVRPMICSHQ